MKKNSLFAAAAVVVAGVAAYFIRKKIITRKHSQTEEPSSGDNRHVTNAFSRAKSHSSSSGESV